VHNKRLIPTLRVGGLLGLCGRVCHRGFSVVFPYPQGGIGWSLGTLCLFPGVAISLVRVNRAPSSNPRPYWDHYFVIFKPCAVAEALGVFPKALKIFAVFALLHIRIPNKAIKLRRPYFCASLKLFYAALYCWR
jgi:hypothetical protein